MTDNDKHHIGDQLTGPEVLDHIWNILTDEQKRDAFGYLLDGDDEEADDE